MTPQPEITRTNATPSVAPFTVPAPPEVAAAIARCMAEPEPLEDIHGPLATPAAPPAAPL